MLYTLYLVGPRLGFTWAPLLGIVAANVKYIKDNGYMLMPHRDSLPPKAMYGIGNNDLNFGVGVKKYKEPKDY